MATLIDHGTGGRGISFADQPLVFQRKRRAMALKGSRKRRSLRTGHVLAMFALLAGFFFAFDRAYLFLISWDDLTIRKIELRCGRGSVRQDLERFFKVRPLGNILLCDLPALRTAIKAHPWIEDVRIQKIFPATLKIEILERVPFALLEKGGLALVDKDGLVLEAPAAADAWACPVVRDEGAFRDRYPEKWQAARACLEDLTPAERAGLLSLECSDDGRIMLEFRDNPVRLIVDGPSVRDKLDRFAACRDDLEAQFGPLEYADLRLEDRIIVRPLDPAPATPPQPKSQKEAD